MQRAAELSPPAQRARRLVAAAELAFELGQFELVKSMLREVTRLDPGPLERGRATWLEEVVYTRPLGDAARVDWDVAMPAAEECRRLATELSEPQWVAPADTVDSIIAGIRGDEERAERAAASAERVAVRTGANITGAFAKFGRIQAAPGAGRHNDAYEAAERLFDPASRSHHPVVACWLIGDLAEAAVHTGRIEEARARVRQVEAAGGGVRGTCIALGLLHGHALLAENEEESAKCFGEPLGADLGSWPFQRARLRLAYGQWLRRQRRIAESRASLRDARDAFDAMGCAAWGDQARKELRASGSPAAGRNPNARDQLTAQELQIAQLAAQGLSNREISQRLYLSPRTIGTHLYHVFPKLAIIGRGELGVALSAHSTPQEREQTVRRMPLA